MGMRIFSLSIVVAKEMDVTSRPWTKADNWHRKISHNEEYSDRTMDDSPSGRNFFDDTQTKSQQQASKSISQPYPYLKSRVNAKILIKLQARYN
jgi:hypothetical protein